MVVSVCACTASMHGCVPVFVRGCIGVYMGGTSVYAHVYSHSAVDDKVVMALSSVHSSEGTAVRMALKVVLAQEYRRPKWRWH